MYSPTYLSLLLGVLRTAGLGTARGNPIPSSDNGASSHPPRAFAPIELARRQASLAQSCKTLKESTAHGAWNLYYSGSGLGCSDSMQLADLPLSTGSDGAWAGPADVCSVANDANRWCAGLADSYSVKQFAIVYTTPTLDDPTFQDSPWSCRLVAADNPDPALFNDPNPSADYVWAWKQ